MAHLAILPVVKHFYWDRNYVLLTRNFSSLRSSSSFSLPRIARPEDTLCVAGITCVALHFPKRQLTQTLKFSWRFFKNFPAYKLMSLPSPSSVPQIKNFHAIQPQLQLTTTLRLHDFAVARDFRVLWISRRNNLLWYLSGYWRRRARIGSSPLVTVLFS